MSYPDRLLLLQVLHTWVASNYVLLSFGFVLILRWLLHIMASQPEEGRRAGDRAWPRWWIRWARFVIGSMIMGTSLFLFGCGVHHFHLAIEALAHAYNQGPLATDVFVGDNQIRHHVLIQGAQAIGGTLLIAGSLILARALRARRLHIE